MNAKDKDDDIEWITVHGNHIPIKKGQSKDEAVKEFIEKQGNKSSDKGGSKENKLVNIKDKVKSEIEKIYADDKDLKDGFVVDTRIKKEHFDDGSDLYAIEVRGELDYEDMSKLSDKLNKVVQKYDRQAYFEQETPGIMIATIDLDKQDVKKSSDKKENKTEDKKAKNSTTVKEMTMSVLNELESFIKGVIMNAEDKEEEKEVKNEDKRKLIEEVGGILKGKVDDEIIRTIMKKMEEASYEPSEKDKADNKCKNEEEDEEKEEKFEEEKEIANKKAKNEEEKEEDKKESENEDEEKDKDDEVDKEEIENKCKNSMDDIKKVVMGGNKKVESKYMSRADRFALGDKY